MIKLLLVTPPVNSLGDFVAALRLDADVELLCAESGQAALKTADEKHIDIVFANENLGDMTGIELAEKMLTVNPMINCAAVSTLSSEEFSEASEGLGLLAQFPANPDKSMAEELLQQVKTIMGRVASSVKRET